MNDSRPFATLRRLIRSRPEPERCRLCSAPLAEAHPHLVEPATRQLLCSCDSCAVLFSGSHDTRYRRVPRDSQLLKEFRLGDACWERLLIPIHLAYFFHSSAAGRVLAFYPSPAGAVE